ncbi:MAG: hypothetical protein LBJ67_17785 [Planctomycetaceae bacterium]|jgi:hypothetical protein|nr:hypothetical protein [Planctomycetaceae bacterium]
MLNNNLADISVFETLQSEQHARIGAGSMSVFNAFQVTVPDLVKEKYTQKIKFKYPTKEEAEKIMKGWRSARLETVAKHGHLIYWIWANGQKFQFSKENADKVLEQAKQVKIEEVD